MENGETHTDLKGWYIIGLLVILYIKMESIKSSVNIIFYSLHYKNLLKIHMKFI